MIVITYNTTFFVKKICCFAKKQNGLMLTRRKVKNYLSEEDIQSNIREKENNNFYNIN